MIRSRILSSAPPMMMTVPSLMVAREYTGGDRASERIG
jgi:hypothetical protein